MPTTLIKRRFPFSKMFSALADLALIGVFVLSIFALDAVFEPAPKTQNPAPAKHALRVQPAPAADPVATLIDGSR